MKNIYFAPNKKEVAATELDNLERKRKRGAMYLYVIHGETTEIT